MTAERSVGRPRILPELRARAVELRSAGKSYGEIADALTDAANGVYVSKASVIRFCRESASGKPVQNSSEAAARERTRSKSGGVRAPRDGGERSPPAAGSAVAPVSKRAKIEERRHIVLRALRGRGRTDRKRFEGRVAHALGVSPATAQADVQALWGGGLVMIGDGNRRLGLGSSVGIAKRGIAWLLEHGDVGERAASEATRDPASDVKSARPANSTPPNPTRENTGIDAAKPPADLRHTPPPENTTAGTEQPAPAPEKKSAAVGERPEALERTGRRCGVCGSAVVWGGAEELEPVETCPLCGPLISFFDEDRGGVEVLAPPGYTLDANGRAVPEPQPRPTSDLAVVPSAPPLVLPGGLRRRPRPNGDMVVWHPDRGCIVYHPDGSIERSFRCPRCGRLVPEARDVAHAEAHCPVRGCTVAFDRPRYKGDRKSEWPAWRARHVVDHHLRALLGAQFADGVSGRELRRLEESLVSGRLDELGGYLVGALARRGRMAAIARRAGSCPLCNQVIAVGELIERVNASGHAVWVHAFCASAPSSPARGDVHPDRADPDLGGDPPAPPLSPAPRRPEIGLGPEMEPEGASAAGTVRRPGHSQDGGLPRGGTVPWPRGEEPENRDANG